MEYKRFGNKIIVRIDKDEKRKEEMAAAGPENKPAQNAQ